MKKMKPLNLKMKAFLAYKDEVSIDFSLLNEGLYEKKVKNHQYSQSL